VLVRVEVCCINALRHHAQLFRGNTCGSTVSAKQCTKQLQGTEQCKSSQLHRCLAAPHAASQGQHMRQYSQRQAVHGRHPPVRHVSMGAKASHCYTMCHLGKARLTNPTHAVKLLMATSSDVALHVSRRQTTASNILSAYLR
jgi:hypothetical protein